MIIGSSGAGKSTLSIWLSKQLNLPLYHLDKYYWKAGWEMTPKPEWKEKVKELTLKPEWIIDGNFGSTMHIRMHACDAIVFLNYNRIICTYRILKRVLTSYGTVRTDMAEGCPEKWDWEFIKYVWNFPKERTPYTLVLLDKFRNKKNIIEIKSRKDLKAFKNYILQLSE